MLDKKTMDEITARVAYVLPGTECKQEEDGRFMLRVPVPYGVESRFWTPAEGSDRWTWEYWRSTGDWSKRNLALSSSSDEWSHPKIAGTPKEIADLILFNYSIADVTIISMEEDFGRGRTEEEEQAATAA